MLFVSGQHSRLYAVCIWSAQQTVCCLYRVSTVDCMLFVSGQHSRLYAVCIGSAQQTVCCLYRVSTVDCMLFVSGQHSRLYAVCIGSAQYVHNAVCIDQRSSFIQKYRGFLGWANSSEEEDRETNDKTCCFCSLTTERLVWTCRQIYRCSCNHDASCSIQ